MSDEMGLVATLRMIVTEFDDEVATVAGDGSGERSDLWTDVDVPIAVVRASLAAIERLERECQASMATIAAERARAEAAEARAERLVAERDEARALVTEANNSLYGSQGYFHSLNGGPFDKYHLASGIEKLKSHGNQQWRRAEAAEALLDFATFSPWLREWCKRHFGKWITHNTAKGALTELKAQSPDDTGGQRK